MTKAVDDDCPPRIRRSHEVSIGSLERASPPHCRALRCPPHGDGRRRTRADNWNGEPRSRACRPGNEGRRAAWRLYADRADRVRRDRFPDLMQGVHRPGAWQGCRGADPSGCRKANPPWRMINLPLPNRSPRSGGNERPADAEPKPAVVEEKPAPRQLEAVAPPQDAVPAIGKPQQPVEAAAVPKRVNREACKRASRSDGCSHFRTYDAASGSYRGYDGRRHSC